MKQNRRGTRHFDPCSRLLAVAALAIVAWGCDATSGNLAGAGGAGGSAGTGVSCGQVAGVGGGTRQRGADAGSSGAATLPICATPPAWNYLGLHVCRPAESSHFIYEASGVLMAVSERFAGGTYCRGGARRLTVQTATCAASVDVYAVDEADIMALLLPLVGKPVSIRATSADSGGYVWYSLLLADARGPLVYVVSSSSCPGSVPSGMPPALASLAVEPGADLCVDDRRWRVNVASRFVAGGQSITLAPTESGRLTIDGNTFDVSVMVCSFTAPGAPVFDGEPAGAWMLKRVN
jgi:hypothetical protein